MGRPLRKDVFGVDVIGTYSGNSGARVTFHDGTALRTDGVIIKQRGAKTFLVARIGDIGTTANYVTAVLQDATPSAYGQMTLPVFLAGGADATPFNAAKITKRIVTDFSGNKYTWRMTNYQDSTGDQIEATAL